MMEEHFDKLIHRISGFDHEHDLARAFQEGTELFQRPGAEYGVSSLCRSVYEIIHLRHRAVVGGHAEPLVIHIEDQVLSHHRQADQSYISFLLHDIILLRIFSVFDGKTRLSRSRSTETSP
jgi:hypothetical protein